MTEQQTSADEDLRSFLLMLREVLLKVVRHIERRYAVGEHKPPPA